jgi:hypothetical protein
VCVCVLTVATFFGDFVIVSLAIFSLFKSVEMLMKLPRVVFGRDLKFKETKSIIELDRLINEMHL